MCMSEDVMRRYERRPRSVGNAWSDTTVEVDGSSP